MRVEYLGEMVVVELVFFGGGGGEICLLFH